MKETMTYLELALYALQQLARPASVSEICDWGLGSKITQYSDKLLK